MARVHLELVPSVAAGTFGFATSAGLVNTGVPVSTDVIGARLGGPALIHSVKVHIVDAHSAGTTGRRTDALLDPSSPSGRWIHGNISAGFFYCCA